MRIKRYVSLLLACPNHALGLVRRGFLAAGIGGQPWAMVRGINTVTLPGVKDSDVAIKKIEHALALLEARHPRQYQRVVADIPRIALVAAGGEAYDHALRCYFANVPLLEQRTNTDVALVLVHEATHARVRKRGVPTDAENRGRIERICTRAEVAVGRRLGLPESDLARVMERLQTPWWTREDMKRRTTAFLESLGFPFARRAGRLK